jgi:hypothetical protein
MVHIFMAAKLMNFGLDGEDCVNKFTNLLEGSMGQQILRDTCSAVHDSTVHEITPRPAPRLHPPTIFTIFLLLKPIHTLNQ